MRIAKTLADLPVGTPIQIDGAYKVFKGLVCERSIRYIGDGDIEYPYIKILFVDGSDIFYYEEDLEGENIMIVEVGKCGEINENR